MNIFTVQTDISIYDRYIVALLTTNVLNVSGFGLKQPAKCPECRMRMVSFFPWTSTRVAQPQVSCDNKTQTKSQAASRCPLPGPSPGPGRTAYPARSSGPTAPFSGGGGGGLRSGPRRGLQSGSPRDRDRAATAGPRGGPPPGPRLASRPPSPTSDHPPGGGDRRPPPRRLMEV